jgi:hypothetical protein
MGSSQNENVASCVMALVQGDLADPAKDSPTLYMNMKPGMTSINCPYWNEMNIFLDSISLIY